MVRWKTATRENRWGTTDGARCWAKKQDLSFSHSPIGKKVRAPLKSSTEGAQFDQSKWEFFVEELARARAFLPGSPSLKKAKPFPQNYIYKKSIKKICLAARWSNWLNLWTKMGPHKTIRGKHYHHTQNFMQNPIHTLRKNL